MTILETWPLAFDPIQVLLGFGGIATLVVGMAMKMRNARPELAGRLVLIGSILLGAAVLYSLVLTWIQSAALPTSPDLVPNCPVPDANGNLPPGAPSFCTT